VEWDKDYIKWFVDGTQYNTIQITNGAGNTQAFQNPFFLLLNMAVGGNWPGFTINDAALPAKMYVDYVRVYQKGAAPVSIQIEAENYAVMSGIQTEACSEGGQDVGWIDANDWIVWNVNIPTTGTYTVQYRVASLNGGGVIQLEKAGGSPVYGSVSVPSTGGWQNWTTISHQVTLQAGQQQIAVKALAGGFNINWLNITQ
jgi:beta-glucanase (GH16 family)